MKFFSRYFSLFLASLLSVVSLTAQETTQEKKADDAFDATKMVGQWAFESGMKAGVASDVAMLEAGVEISDESFTMPTGGGTFVMAYEIDASKTPAHVDMNITAGPAPEGEARGIIAFEDGKLKLCYNATGGERPTAFESTEDDGNFMFVMVNKKVAVTKEAIVGTWKYASGNRGGEAVPAERLVGQVVVTEETFTLPASGTESFVMAYQLDGDASPTAVDFEIKEGPVPEGKALGVLKMDGDNLVLCYDPAGANRPEMFEATADNGFFMFVLEPVKEE